jgi:hypothetical protein
MAHATHAHRSTLDADARAFYSRSIDIMSQAGIPFLVGGAYAFAQYTGIERHTRDFDIFVRPEDAPAALDALAQSGYTTELPFPHWLGKAHCGGDYVDIIYRSGNGVSRVDDHWFESGYAA